MEIRENILLAPFTTFRIGGPARFFVEVESEDETKEAIQYALDKKLDYFILGGGSNILVSDKGFDGLVIKIRNAKYEIRNTEIECSAGLILSEVVKIASENSLSGLEWAAGIPGTLGGAVRGNAGAFGGSIADSVEKIRVTVVSRPSDEKAGLPNFQFPISLAYREAGNFQTISNDKIIQNIVLNRDECGFGYRDSIFKKDKNSIILSVTLKLTLGKKENIKNRVAEITKARVAKQPKGFSAGSYFKNPSVNNSKLIEEFEAETGAEARGGVLPAGWLVERCGLSGRKVGGAMVSEKHANFIVNTGRAKAEDILMLASIIKQKVRDELGVQLQEEVQLVGF